MTHFLLSFFAALGIMLILSRWRLWVGVFAAVIVFGLFNYHWHDFLSLSLRTISSLPNWFLIIGVGLIPVLGTIMCDSIRLAEILGRLKRKKKLYLVTTPLLFGLLPIPGGALMSCPLIKGVDGRITGERYVVINLWFRHILVIVYPLSSSLIIGSQLAGLTIMQAVTAMMPMVLIMIPAGYFLLLKGLHDETEEQERPLKKQSVNKTIGTLLIFLAAPVIHIVLSMTVLSDQEQLSFFIAMTCSLIIALISNKISFRYLPGLIKKSKVEQFSLLLLFMLIFLDLVRNYEALDSVFQGFHPPIFFVGILSVVMSFLSGRIEIGLSIVYPFIFTVYEITSFSPLFFTFVYFSLFTGYLISPLHPCMAFSIEYFQTSYLKVMKTILPVLLIPLAMLWIIFLFL